MTSNSVNGVIYCYTSPSGKKYVGQTVREERRKSDHALAASKGPFHCAVRKYGYDAMEYEVLHSGVCSLEELNRLEQEEIARLGCIKPHGYNLDSGGRNCLHHESTKQKIREKATGRQISEETREKLRESHRGRKLSEEQKEKLRQAVLGTKRGEEFKAKMRAIRGTPEAREKARAARLGTKTTGKALENLRKNHATQKVLCLTTGVLYQSMKEATADTGVQEWSIRNDAKGKVVGRHYRWKYV